jgi:hypothetical protein
MSLPVNLTRENTFDIIRNKPLFRRFGREMDDKLRREINAFFDAAEYNQDEYRDMSNQDIIDEILSKFKTGGRSRRHRSRSKTPKKRSTRRKHSYKNKSRKSRN